MGFLHRVDLIRKCCRDSGRWRLASQEGDLYWVRANDTRSLKEILVRYREDRPGVLFQAWFPVRFPLDDPPSGLFGRLLLRNVELHYARWAMCIGESCEACLHVASYAPRPAMDAVLFNFICREIVDEIHGFHDELHNKFRYSAALPVRGQGGGGRAEVRYVEPMPDPLPSPESAWRMLHEEGGTVRYRLPGPEGMQ